MFKTLVLAATAVSALAISGPVQSAEAQDAFIGEIRIMPYTYCPRNWTATNGQELPIAQNQALFSLMGSTYGGDGRVTMGIPEARGRVLLHTGTSPNGTPYPLGQRGGVEFVSDVVRHTHTVAATTADGDVAEPNGAAIANVTVIPAYTNTNVTQVMHVGTVASNGGPPDVANIQPSSGVQYCLATSGTYPPRP
ncbi:MAG: tail fiber protein [Pseudomonadota bacterium]